MDKFEYVNDLQDEDLVVRRDPLTGIWSCRIHETPSDDFDPEGSYTWGVVGVAEDAITCMNDWWDKYHARAKLVTSRDEAKKAEIERLEALKQRQTVRRFGFGGKRIG